MPDFLAPADEVAPQLLGCVLHARGVALRITEVEAYLGSKDPASHAFRGPTPRNRAMFERGGCLYVYFSYGIHLAGNIVCGPEGTGQGCLIRAGEIVAGAATAQQRRGPKVPAARLAQGPGNVGQALGLRIDDNGARLTGPEFVLRPPEDGARPEWVRGRRIGISKNADAPLRFWVPNDPSVSSPRSRARAWQP
ncbi:DNA-3-methyladenine glycosylase [Corynebacterium uberis]|uniref:DNA-3-methyladenine glycosylase n=1 Tax=Corynebacterium sp. c6VSa_13 TaxID=2913496 RepID=UPI001D09C162|nr:MULTISPECIES: DNA-3-methyladenine glycosylase [Corynebacterium]MCZ9309836.1 DNA-3-methyladenine glycosylase [Corynebacterium sp. c6VSa_13]UDL74777.1 DNA-3-methyladenine glycosylase [Corynebacterium uberis]UDL77034.1 DNA-3-methyladenine glycosylase [Corynebacterium uberis]UDL79245.1 DNA-3-methyladenine glycosylase [Corynebacterium uberis]UDL81450.1 DNA-3-methyladenine glycosylase [Corynebacterium uberis]